MDDWDVGIDSLFSSCPALHIFRGFDHGIGQWYRILIFASGMESAILAAIRFEVWEAANIPHFHAWSYRNKYLEVRNL